NKLSIMDGGGVTNVLKQLEQSGFISSYVPFGKMKKDKLYRLTDCYSLFYLKFIKNIPSNETPSWQSISQSQSWKTWSGYAFENICLIHIENIKNSLGISGIQSSQSSFVLKASEENEGIQIDFLIDRSDKVISLCEVKFYDDKMVLSKDDVDNLRRKRGIFKQATSTKKQIFLVLITTFGLQNNKYSLGFIDTVLDMNDLFT
ncbi:MAG TPA: ATP-binding protein, partial [Saprospiraceae bacterium]|nr:ATP-binding protein [Saprospiraceae bacterium]